MTVTDRWLVADTADLVAPLIERVASRLVEAMRSTSRSRADRVTVADGATSSLAAEPRRRQLLDRRLRPARRSRRSTRSGSPAASVRSIRPVVARYGLGSLPS